MLEALAVGVGGFVGAIARYGLTRLVQHQTSSRFPLGTLTVNVLGCFLIGVLMTLIEERDVFSPRVRLLLVVGVLGSLTTFSTFGFDIIGLIRVGQAKLAVLNVAASVVLGLAAVLLGRALALATV